MKKIVSALLFSFIALSGLSQDAATALHKKHYNLDKGVAIDGYDPVSYFTQNKAVKGKKELAVVHQGVVYFFSNESNKEEFRKNASKYEPEYGGWCAYAMGASGEKVDIDPETFKIINGKLYLFYNKYFNNTLTKWNKDEAGLKQKADQHWQKTFH
jgi:YHS domain-containing protein